MVNSYRNGDEFDLAKNNTIKATSTINFNMSTASDSSEYKLIEDVINGLLIKLENTESIKNKERLTKLNFYIDNDYSLDLSMYAKNNDQFIYLKDMYNKYIKLPSTEYLSYYDTTSVDDMEYLTNKVKDLFLSSLKSDYFKVSSTTLSLDDKKIDVKKVLITVNDKRAKEILRSILRGIIKDSKSINILIKYMNNGGKSEDVIKSLNEAINTLNQDNILDKDITLSVYVNGLLSTAVKYEISTGSKDDAYGLSYLVYNKNNKVVHKIILGGNNYTDGILKFVSDDSNTEFTIYTGESNKIADGTIKSSSKIVKKAKEYKSNQDIAINLYEDINSKITFSIKSTSDTLIGASMDTVNLTGAVNYESLTEEDQAGILTNLYGLLGGVLMKYTPTDTTTSY
jgi:hypothetical protein